VQGTGERASSRGEEVAAHCVSRYSKGLNEKYIAQVLQKESKKLREKLASSGVEVGSVHVIMR